MHSDLDVTSVDHDDLIIVLCPVYFDNGRLRQPGTVDQTDISIAVEKAAQADRDKPNRYASEDIKSSLRHWLRKVPPQCNRSYECGSNVRVQEYLIEVSTETRKGQRGSREQRSKGLLNIRHRTSNQGQALTMVPQTSNMLQLNFTSNMVITT